MKLPVYLGLGLLLLLGGAYTCYWFFVAAKLQVGVEAWIAEQRAMGNDVVVGEGSIDGFPLTFRRDFGTAKMLLQGVVPIQIMAGSAVAEIKPWNLNTVIVNARDLSFSRARGVYKAATLDGNIDIPKTPPADYLQPFLGFDITVTNIALPEGQRAVTTAPIETLAARGAVMGPMPTAPDIGQALTGWANAGGVLELKSVSFAQTPLEAEGEGTLALDEALQPLGALTLRALGVTETVDLLASQGLLNERNAKTAKIMVQGLAKPNDAGRLQVDLSLSLQQGYLWLGPIKLARLPHFNG